jgi:hemerythrin
MLETYLKTRTMPVYDEQKQLLTEMFNKLPKAAELNSQQDQWHDTIEPIMEQVPEFMTKTFGDWEFVSAEYEMFEPIEKEDGYFFKGYVDGIIKANDKVVIIDWKTSANFWDKSKIKDPKKYMQLVLYKHFYSIKNNVPLENISCGFVILRRKVTKTNKERCMFIPIEVNTKELEEAEKLIHQFFLSIKKHYYSKNRDSCRFCVYYNTAHCKG